VNPEDLSDDECWRIHMAVCTANGRPDGFTDVVPRDYWIGYTREFLPSCPIAGLAEYERVLKLAGEDKLANWVRMLRQERQALN
jgi:hypothetical protein